MLFLFKLRKNNEKMIFFGGVFIYLFVYFNFLEPNDASPSMVFLSSIQCTVSPNILFLFYLFWDFNFVFLLMYHKQCYLRGKTGFFQLI